MEWKREYRMKDSEKRNIEERQLTSRRGKLHTQVNAGGKRNRGKTKRRNRVESRK